jgi:hypothetical protein
VLIKEREAVQTVMEKKIKTLVQSVAQNFNSIMQNFSQNSTPNNTIVQNLSKVFFIFLIECWLVFELLLSYNWGVSK